jgi:hypothetical protein
VQRSETKLGFYSATYGTVTADDIKKVPYKIVELYLAELNYAKQQEKYFVIIPN